MSNHGTSMNKQINPTNAIYIMFIIYIIIFILIMILINNKKLGCSHHNITLVSFKGLTFFQSGLTVGFIKFICRFSNLTFLKTMNKVVF